MASSEQIDAWARKHRVRGWLGARPADELPAHVPQTPWSLVVNYQGHDHPGDHWVAAMGSHGRAYWFSSFGLPPDGADVILGDRTQFRRWLSRVAPRGWKHNEVPLQSLEGDTCSKWGVYACKVRGGPRGVPAAYGWCGRDRKRNDAGVSRVVRFLPDA